MPPYPYDAFWAAEPLLTAQCWFWGCDIRRSAGNLLLAYGFERYGSPVGNDGSSSYTLYTGTGDVIRLWGFGVAVLPAGGNGYFFRRYQRQPWPVSGSIHHAAVYLIGQAERFRMRAASQGADAGQCLLALANTVSRYEEWIEASAGPDWRQSTIREGGTRIRTYARPAEAWRMVAQLLTTRGLLV
jgi:hypothetical protein